jgi:hypothetical protein
MFSLEGSNPATLTLFLPFDTGLLLLLYEKSVFNQPSLGMHALRGCDWNAIPIHCVLHTFFAMLSK